MPESTRDGRPKALARWLVTSRQGPWSRNQVHEATWAPVGTHHTRQTGCRQMAWGEPAHERELFWEIPFYPSAALSCHASSRSVAATAFRP
jgi:hypothetical protein